MRLGHSTEKVRSNMDQVKHCSDTLTWKQALEGYGFCCELQEGHLKSHRSRTPTYGSLQLRTHSVNPGNWQGLIFSSPRHSSGSSSVFFFFFQTKLCLRRYEIRVICKMFLNVSNGNKFEQICIFKSSAIPVFTMEENISKSF